MQQNLSKLLTPDIAIVIFGNYNNHFHISTSTAKGKYKFFLKSIKESDYKNFRNKKTICYDNAKLFAFFFKISSS